MSLAVVPGAMVTGVASAHPDRGGGREDFPGEGVADCEVGAFVDQGGYDG